MFAASIDVILQMEKYLRAAGANVEFGRYPNKAVAFVGVIVEFHGPRVFQFFQFMVGLLAVGAMGFTFAQMHRTRELVAIMAAGVPLRRCVWAVLGAALSAVTMRMTRTMMLEVLRQDYIRTAMAKGLPERLVVFRHALRNALIPVVTLIGLQAPLVIGGAVIIEQIFGIPGMGTLLLDAVNQRDYPIITGVFLVVGLAVMLINLVVDLSYGLLDPRVRVRS